MTSDVFEKRILRIPVDASGKLVSRKNRFLADVDIGDSIVEAHVHDPGRLKEVLYPENKVLLRRASGPKRRTDWDVISGKVKGEWVLIHSGYHSSISLRILDDPACTPFPGFRVERSEVSFGKSRMDHLLTDGRRQMVLEVKGCSLTSGSDALFPDAPTKRGTRHVRELINLLQEGYMTSMLILVIGPEPLRFRPNRDTDPDFAEAFVEAVRSGVDVKAVRIRFDGSHVLLGGEVPISVN